MKGDMYMFKMVALFKKPEDPEEFDQYYFWNALAFDRKNSRTPQSQRDKIYWIADGRKSVLFDV